MFMEKTSHAEELCRALTTRFLLQAVGVSGAGEGFERLLHVYGKVAMFVCSVGCLNELCVFYVLTVLAWLCLSNLTSRVIDATFVSLEPF